VRKATILSVALVAVLAVGVATASAVDAKTRVNVTLTEFKIKPVPTTVAAGKVTFLVKNAGKVEHEFVVIKTKLAPGKLPVSGNEASEKGAVGEVGELAPGKSGRVTLNLKPGKYVFICNLPSHYKLGQYIGFRVS
jgi:uncharacterized cupredoxin-like copper-binding protein